MLNEDDRSLEARISPLAVRDPVQGEDVPVLGGSPVLLSRVAVVPDEVGLKIRDPILSDILSRGHLTVGSSFLRTGLADLATLPGSVWYSSSLFSHQPSLPATPPTATNRRISPLSPITESSGWPVFTVSSYKLYCQFLSSNVNSSDDARHKQIDVLLSLLKTLYKAMNTVEAIFMLNYLSVSGPGVKNVYERTKITR